MVDHDVMFCLVFDERVSLRDSLVYDNFAQAYAAIYGDPVELLAFNGEGSGE